MPWCAPDINKKKKKSGQGALKSVFVRQGENAEYPDAAVS